MNRSLRNQQRDLRPRRSDHPTPRTDAILLVRQKPIDMVFAFADVISAAGLELHAPRILRNRRNVKRLIKVMALASRNRRDAEKCNQAVALPGFEFARRKRGVVAGEETKAVA